MDGSGEFRRLRITVTFHTGDSRQEDGTLIPYFFAFADNIILKRTTKLTLENLLVRFDRAAILLTKETELKL